MKYPDDHDRPRPASDLFPAGEAARDETPATPYTAHGGYVVVPDPDTSGDRPFRQWLVSRDGEPAARVARLETTTGIVWFCTVHPGAVTCDHVAAVRAAVQE